MLATWQVPRIENVDDSSILSGLSVHRLIFNSLVALSLKTVMTSINKWIFNRKHNHSHHGKNQWMCNYQEAPCQSWLTLSTEVGPLKSYFKAIEILWMMTGKMYFERNGGRFDSDSHSVLIVVSSLPLFRLEGAPDGRWYSLDKMVCSYSSGRLHLGLHPDCW